MNSSLQRACTARGRLLHRSKNLEAVIIKLPSGAELHAGMRVSKEPGVTANFGFNRAKRMGTPTRILRAVKRAAWESGRA